MNSKANQPKKRGFCRKDDAEEKNWFRMDRFYVADGRWFFSTREGEEVGPFVSRAAANNGVAAYIRHTKIGRVSGIYAAKIAKGGVYATNLYK